MAEVITRACEGCPTEIVIPPGRGQKPKWCDPCKARNQKERDAERHRLRQAGLDAQRAANPPKFRCGRCGESFPKPRRDGPMPKHCDLCGHQRKLDHLGERRRAATVARRPETFRCEICLRRRPVVNVHGPVPRICDGCRLESRRRVARAAYAERVSPIRSTFVCPGCKQEFPLVRKGYSRRRCDPCAALKTRAQIDAWYKARPERLSAKNREGKRRRRVQRRAIGCERFTDREIFERDGWLCGLCGGAVDQTLIYPHLMSASLDHWVPLNRHGLHTRKNTRCTHFLCNSRKSDRLDSEVLHLFPYLAAQLTA